jgi:methenyltetrahydrofolate cyclohydrolase
MMYRTQSLKRYLDDLSAKIPAPGGGSSAAVCAAMAAALQSMVIRFTLGKPQYAKHQKQLQKLLRCVEKLRQELLILVDDDVTAYKSKNMNKALQVPLKVCQLSSLGMSLCPVLAHKGNRNILSDCLIAAVLFEAAFTSAAATVKVNLPYIQDKRVSLRTRNYIATTAGKVRRLRTNVEATIGRTLAR